MHVHSIGEGEPPAFDNSLAHPNLKILGWPSIGIADHQGAVHWAGRQRNVLKAAKKTKGPGHYTPPVARLPDPYLYHAPSKFPDQFLEYRRVIDAFDDKPIAGARHY